MGVAVQSEEELFEIIPIILFLVSIIIAAFAIAIILIWGSVGTIAGIIVGDAATEIDYTGVVRAPWETSIIEITSMILMAELVYAGVKLRQLRRKEKKALKAESAKKAEVENAN